MISCPSCRSQLVRYLSQTVAGDDAAMLYACDSCSLQFVHGGIVIDKAYYDEWRPEGETPYDRFQRQHDIARYSVNAFMELVPKGSSVLEVGCSAGGFLARIQKHYHLQACERNSTDRDFVNKVGEIPCTEDIPEGKYDAVIARQTFEHQTDPHQFWRSITECLVPGGIAFLEVPNLDWALISNIDLPDYRAQWYTINHRLYWSGQSLRQFFAQYDLTPEITCWTKTNIWSDMGRLHGVEAVNTNVRSAYAKVMKETNDVYRKALVKAGLSDHLRIVIRT